ncbi:MAG: D-aminoacyl-tRNA deacylase [Bacilli bacterium]|jgi:D-tyrosyl-tRNA(Tyr) deacylase|nr:D-aminoacyl-tRNA deacylase [Bacilli bacterium]NLN79803.1 D-tyrosyl-tRNA(Tyr) deacylase [Erysipelotrichia bacterium]
MRIIVQNVKKGQLVINNKVISTIGKGYVLLIGFNHFDDESVLPLMADKILNMRVFPDQDDKTNLSLLDINGEILAIPQFTLYANLKKGRRPSFTEALEPIKAKAYFEKFVLLLKKGLPSLKSGVFGEHMEIELINDGPFTLILDSKDLF